MKGDTPVNSTMSVGQARKLVEQLKIEASFCRIKVRHTRLRFRQDAEFHFILFEQSTRVRIKLGE